MTKAFWMLQRHCVVFAGSVYRGVELHPGCCSSSRVNALQQRNLMTEVHGVGIGLMPEHE